MKQLEEYISEWNSRAKISWYFYLILKEQCHEDFAVLGQFCAQIIALRL